jgi:hypothetical protein
MKKLFFMGAFFLGFFYPMMAQDLDVNEIQPVEKMVLTKDKIPAAVNQAVSKDFRNGQPVKWGNFPYVLKEYGWVVDKADNTKPDYYEVFIKTENGSDMYAIYSSDGKLIRSKEILRNMPLPKSIEEALFKSEYKDWKKTGDLEKITNFMNAQKSHYIVTVEKNNKTHHLYFDDAGTMLRNKTGHS